MRKKKKIMMVSENNKEMDKSIPYCNAHKLAQEIVVQSIYGKTVPELEQELWALTKCQWKVTKVKYFPNFNCNSYQETTDHWHWILRRITM